MKIDALPIMQIKNLSINKEGDQQGVNFQELFKNALDSVNNAQLEKEKKSIDFALGGVNAPDIHEVMISMEKASIALNLTIEVRNKLVEAYQEIMRMQV